MAAAAKSKFVVLSILLLLALLAVTYFFRPKTPAPAPVMPDPDLIAEVGPHQIRVEQFRQEMLLRGGNYPEKLDKRALLEEMIEKEALVVQAIAAGLDQDPEFIRSYRNLLIGKLRQRDVAPQLRQTAVSGDEIAAYYERHVGMFTTPARIRLAIIFMKTSSKMSEDYLNKVEHRLSQAREKALNQTDVNGFGKLAIDYSEDQSTRYRGGDIGWIDEKEEQTDYKWEEVVIAAGAALTDVGDVSEIVRGHHGLYLVKLTGREQPRVKELESVREQIRHKMLLEKRKETERAFVMQATNSVDIAIYEDVLDSVATPVAPISKASHDKPAFP